MRSHPDDAHVNRSTKATFAAVLDARLARRDVLLGGLGAAALVVLGAPTPGRANAMLPLAFKPVPVSTADTVTVPDGYAFEVLYAWGDPVSEGPVFKPDASNSADEQAQQAGMHHDGIHYFPLPYGSDDSTRGLLAINHE